MLKTQRLLILIGFSIFLAISPTRVSAQNSQSVETTVGTPPENEEGGSGGGSVYFYCQYGSVNSSGKLTKRAWWNIPQGQSFSRIEPNASQCDIEGTGCGPTSIAMIMTTQGTRRTPTEVALGSGKQGCGGTYGGTSAYDIETDFTRYLTRNGFTITGNLVNGTRLNTDAARKFIDRGYLLVGGASMRYMTNSGYHLGDHAFVISGYSNSSSDSFTTYDPTFCEGTGFGGERPLIDVNNFDLDGRNNVEKWYYVYAIKKL